VGQHFGVSGFGVSRVQKPNINTQQFPEIVKSDQALRDFGVRDFVSTKAKHQHTTTPEIAKSDQHFGISEFRISRSRKQSAFQDFGVWDFASQTSTHNNSRNCEKVKWDQHFGISGFGNFASSKVQTST
jgi:hypothetical protein